MAAESCFGRRSFQASSSVRPSVLRSEDIQSESQSWTKIGCSPCQSVRNTCALILRPSGGGSARGVSRAPSWVGTEVDGVSPRQKWTASRATASALKRKIVESSALRDAKQYPEIPDLRGAGDEQPVVR